MSQKLKFTILSTVDEMMTAFPLINQMYNDFNEENYRRAISEMIAINKFKMIACLEGEKMVGVSGFWILRMLYCGRYLQLSNLVVSQEKRGLGIGTKILNQLENIAKKMGCETIILDSYTENKKSHSLYFAQGFHIRGHHFMKDL